MSKAVIWLTVCVGLKMKLLILPIVDDIVESRIFMGQNLPRAWKKNWKTSRAHFLSSWFKREGPYQAKEIFWYFEKSANYEAEIVHVTFPEFG